MTVYGSMSRFTLASFYRKQKFELKYFENLTKVYGAYMGQPHNKERGSSLILGSQADKK